MRKINKQCPHFIVDYKHSDSHVGQSAITDMDGFPLPVVIKRVQPTYDAEGASVVFEAETDKKHFRKEYAKLVGFTYRTYPRLTPDHMWPNMAAYFRWSEPYIDMMRKNLAKVLETHKESKALPSSIADTARALMSAMCESLDKVAIAVGSQDWVEAQKWLDDGWEGYTNTFRERIDKLFRDVDYMESLFCISTYAKGSVVCALYDRLKAKRAHHDKSTAAWNKQKMIAGRAYLKKKGFVEMKPDNVFVFGGQHGTIYVRLDAKGVWHASYVVVNTKGSVTLPLSGAAKQPVMIRIGQHVIMQARNRALQPVLMALCTKCIGDRDKFNAKWQSLFSGKPSECYGMDIETVWKKIKDMADTSWEPKWRKK